MKAVEIKDIHAREILDSRGNPTIECDITTELGVFRAAVPSGASTGIYEALELRDKDPKRYNGKGVLKAVSNVNDIIKPKLIGKSVMDQEKLDMYMIEQLDGTKNEYGFCKKNLGANAILSVSLALARAAAAANHEPLYSYIAGLAGRRKDKFVMPVPSLNIINGGSHAGNKLNFQEFMILPTGAKSFTQAMQYAAETYASLQKCLKEKFGPGAINVGDEGGFGAPEIGNEYESLDLVVDAINKANHKGDITIGMDVAASEFYSDKESKYNMGWKTKETGKMFTGDEMLGRYTDLVSKYPIATIEDPFDQDDWASYTKMNASLSEKIQIVGDDLLVTNQSRIKMAIEKKACNALLLKVNQIGSLTESIKACNMAVEQGWGVMVSHRSGETEDCFIADLVVGLGVGEIKTGAPCRSDRLAKYNQLMRIEEELGPKAIYAGVNFRKGVNLLK
jgi:enolase